MNEIPTNEPARTLAQSGIAAADMDPAVEATRRCRRITGWAVEDAAEFVATAAALGDITGPSLLLVPNLARIATRGAGGDERVNTIPPNVATRLADLERALVAIQFDHPAQRARLVDEWFASRRGDDVEQLRGAVRKVCLYALGRRAFWAHRDGAAAVARAVAYQSIAGDLIRLLDTEPGSRP